MDTSKYLPIGTVVKLKDGTRKMMITGYKLKNRKSDAKFDYMGCLYPDGVLDPSKINLFNHNQIQYIYHFGLRDEEGKIYLDLLNKE